MIFNKERRNKIKDRFKFKAINIKTKEVVYIDNLYWFEENGIEYVDDDGVARGFTGLYYIVQSTELRDKNDKLIYETDIVKTDYGDIGIIKYSSHFCRWQIVFKKGREHLLKYKEIGVHIFDFIYPKICLEIIGNIYENPELLEANK